MDVIDEYFSSNTVSLDFSKLILGDRIGGGVYREVYECNIEPSLVVKIETSSKSFCNIMEWEAWERVKEVEGIRDWFAPCVDISPCGIILLQRMTSPIVAPCDLPDKIPHFFTDIKHENFGFLKNNFVCHDYGSNLLMEQGMSKRLKKANWPKNRNT